MPRFDDAKRREFLALIRAGCSRRTASSYVRCDPGTPRYHAIHDPEFAAQLHRAEVGREVIQLQHIQEAAKRSWRAAAWLLERLNPSDFRRKEPDNMTPTQVGAMLDQFSSVVCEHIKDPEVLKLIRDHFGALSATIDAATRDEIASGKPLRPVAPGTDIPEPDFLIPEEKLDKNSSQPGTP